MAKRKKGRNLTLTETDSVNENEEMQKSDASLLADQIVRMSSEKYQMSKIKKENEEMMLRGENNVVIINRKKLKKNIKDQKQSRRVLVYFAIEGKWKEMSVKNLG
ncbi:MAG: hypothetical protein GXO74_15605 [Calditrichaeota bacterium]|nr:hypothetical protein [Calditrichota bacterium]